jgi:ABC-type uncharacterized transport system YnjBCD substrate-binding protein
MRGRQRRRQRRAARPPAAAGDRHLGGRAGEGQGACAAAAARGAHAHARIAAAHRGRRHTRPSAQGTTVAFASWSDQDSAPPLINPYLDNVFGAFLRSSADVILDRIPLAATSDAVATVHRTVASGAPGEIDLIWINGHNFKASRLAAAMRWQLRCDD